ncbi:hypothetical protein INT80_10480 [Gallibacterium anatis]|uniref:Uncharacterized protein n=1 Tax=Gallibacterium anatis TaxID=750 RepID=A0A930UWR4_9PAST|nr:hypothetical protein [Gallibacterium anatis]
MIGSGSYASVTAALTAVNSMRHTLKHKADYTQGEAGLTVNVASNTHLTGAYC